MSKPIRKNRTTERNMYGKPILELNGEPVRIIDGSKIEIIGERPDEIDYLGGAKKSISFNLKVSDDSIKWMEEQTKEYYKFFGGVMKKDSVTDWAGDIERLEAELYKFADIKELRPRRKAMKEAKAVIEEKYNVKLEELK